MTRDDIEGKIKEHFAAFDRAKFAEWLEKGLSNYYSPSRNSESSHPFDPVYPMLIYRDAKSYSAFFTVSSFIREVYGDFFPDSGKQMFREAIGDVLDNQVKKRQLPLAACVDLIYLTGKVKAEESLESLVSFAGQAALEEEEKNEFNYDTIAALQMFEPSEKIYEATGRLADTHNFNEGYLFEVIELLVKNKPSNTRNILEKIEPRIKKLQDSLPDDVKEIKAFLRCKDKCLKLVSSEANPSEYEGTWLTEDYKPLNEGN